MASIGYKYFCSFIVFSETKNKFADILSRQPKHAQLQKWHLYQRCCFNETQYYFILYNI